MKPTELQFSLTVLNISARFTLALLFASCILLSSHSALSNAQEASLIGTWRHANDEKELSQRYEAIDQATQSLGALLRGRAQEQLRGATVPAKELILAEEKVETTSAVNNRPVTMTIGGPAVKISGKQGDVSMQVRRDEGKLVLTARGGSGTRTTVFTLSEDGTRLILQTSLVSSKLGKPIRYTDTYERH